MRHLDLVVISDVHLGTYGCHAKELLKYLKSIKPRILVLNGDIIDIWAFKKKYFPKSHLEVIRRILQMASNETRVYYIPGNHDDLMRRFEGAVLGPIQVRNQIVLQLKGKKYWFFHGDVFDASVRISPLLAKLGGKSYDYLIRINRLVNQIREKLGKEKMSFSKTIKEKVKRAAKFIGDFEQLAIDAGIQSDMDGVVCGHIHIPQKRVIKSDGGEMLYLNSGDWVENLCSLEFNDGIWSIYRYEKDLAVKTDKDPSISVVNPKGVLNLE